MAPSLLVDAGCKARAPALALQRRNRGTPDFIRHRSTKGFGRHEILFGILTPGPGVSDLCSRRSGAISQREGLRACAARMVAPRR